MAQPTIYPTFSEEADQIYTSGVTYFLTGVLLLSDSLRFPDPLERDWYSLMGIR